MRNFKGNLWNSTQNILPIHRKLCSLFEKRRSKSSQTYKLISIFETSPRSSYSTWGRLPGEYCWDYYSGAFSFLSSYYNASWRLVPMDEILRYHLFKWITLTWPSKWIPVNSSPPSAWYMCQWTGSVLLQVMACRLLGAKPLPEPILTCCQMDP